MIVYDWQKIKRLCNFDIINVLQYFCLKEKIWMPDYLPKEYKHSIYMASKEPYPKGSSYLINIRPLLINKRGFYIDEIYCYLCMASLRSYFDYKIRNIVTLPVIIAESANACYLNNPLMKLIDYNIHFRYETEETD